MVRILIAGIKADGRGLERMVGSKHGDTGIEQL